MSKGLEILQRNLIACRKLNIKLSELNISLDNNNVFWGFFALVTAANTEVGSHTDSTTQCS